MLQVDGEPGFCHVTENGTRRAVIGQDDQETVREGPSTGQALVRISSPNTDLIIAWLVLRVFSPSSMSPTRCFCLELKQLC